MHPRLNPQELTPDLVSKATSVQLAIEALGLEKSLIELLKIRTSQINGCAYCLNMHTTDARAHGETEARIYVLPAWRESTLYTPRERAALAWAESLTHISERGAPDALYADLKAHFTEKEIVAVTSAIAMMNFWNRMAVAFGTVHPNESAAAR